MLNIQARNRPVIRDARWPVFHRPGRYFTANLAGRYFEDQCLQPVFWKLKFQKVLRNFMKSFRWVRKSLLQTEVNIARKNLLVVLLCS